MTYRTPRELEAEMAAAFEALLDEEDARLTGTLNLARLALDDGGGGVMRVCLTEIVTRLSLIVH